VIGCGAIPAARATLPAPSPTPVSVSGNPQEHEVDTAHDSKEHDPSRGNRYRLKSPLSQRQLLLTGVGGVIEKNVNSSFRKMLSLHRKGSDSWMLSSPSMTRLYGLNSDRYQPKAENGLSLVNADHEYAGISDREFGYCWGFSTLFRNLTQLAFFDPSLPKDPNPESYFRMIDRIISGRATVIPGYRNLRELSLEPQVELYLKLNAMQLWRSRAARRTSLPIFRNSTEAMSFTEVEDLLVRLEEKLSRGEFPKILFSALIPSGRVLGMSTDIHVVLVNRIERLGGSRARIYLWDINFYAEILAKSPKFIEVTQTHGLKYAPWYEADKPYAEASDLVSRIQIAPEDDAENLSTLKGLKAFCDDPATRRYCTK
jgi:hypothetical protein